jgi:putative ABC transport system substrate-binding protein
MDCTGNRRNRRTFVFGVGGLAVVPVLCSAQAQERVWRIGVLESVPQAMNVANMAAFRAEMQHQGYVEGRNLGIEYRSSDGRAERFAHFAAELVAMKVDLIVTASTVATIAAKDATRSIPVVVVRTGEPLLVVSSLSHPGGNVTGLSSVTVDLEAKRFGLLREAVPTMTRVAVLCNMSSPVDLPRWKEVEHAARSVGVVPQLLDVRKAEELDAAFASASQQRADGLLVGNDGLFRANQEAITHLAAKFRLPAIYRSLEQIDAGGLMAYGPDYTDLYRRAAGYVNKILKGAKPGDLPVEQPTKFELIINLKAAKMINVSIPQSLLLRADRLIQ